MQLVIPSIGEGPGFFFSGCADPDGVVLLSGKRHDGIREQRHDAVCFGRLSRERRLLDDGIVPGELSGHRCLNRKAFGDPCGRMLQERAFGIVEQEGVFVRVKIVPHALGEFFRCLRQIGIRFRPAGSLSDREQKLERYDLLPGGSREAAEATSGKDVPDGYEIGRIDVIDVDDRSVKSGFHILFCMFEHAMPVRRTTMP